MLNIQSLIAILEVILVVVPALLTVAFVTIAERKTMASMQRRLGPNIVGYYGLLQAFADALKLLLKEYVGPTQANLNLTINIEAQKVVLFVLPLLPIFIIFFIGCIAETNRAPFDLAEAESELVSGFMTEHSAVIFVFFFLAEYASIVLICIFTSILFLGGYLSIFSLDFLLNIIYIFNLNINIFNILINETNVNFFNLLIDGLVSSLMLGLKSSLLIFVFI